MLLSFCADPCFKTGTLFIHLFCFTSLILSFFGYFG